MHWFVKCNLRALRASETIAPMASSDGWSRFISRGVISPLGRLPNQKDLLLPYTGTPYLLSRFPPTPHPTPPHFSLLEWMIGRSSKVAEVRGSLPGKGGWGGHWF
jgi:hypothetical protein